MDGQPMENQPLNNQPQAPEGQPQAAGDGVQVVSNQDNGTSTFDISTLFKDGEVGVYDDQKIADTFTKLQKDLSNSQKSASYFQSQFMKKNDVPENVEDYRKDFQPDSKYEKLMETEAVKNLTESFYNWAKENQISRRDANKFLDLQLKGLVENGILETRTEEELAKIDEENTQKQIEQLQPMLASLGRTFDENNIILNSLFESKNPFTADENIKNYMMNKMPQTVEGYKVLTLLANIMGHTDIPAITGTIESHDKNALMKELMGEDDPIVREQKMKQFYGE